MAKSKVVFIDGSMAQFLKNNPEIRKTMMDVGKEIQAAAENTAQDAQNGPGGTLYGYAEAGFEVVWESRGKRPRVLIRSLADSDMALRVHFYTQKRDGIAHMRKALSDGIK